MKRFLLLILVLIITVSLFSACKSKTTIPIVEIVSQYTDEELQEFASTVDEQELIDAWGEPQIVDSRRFWPVPLDGATEYLIANVDNGEITSLYKSYYLFVTVVADGYCLYGFNDYSTNCGDLAFMPTQDVFGNPIECEVGDAFVFQFDGIIMETYPAQLNLPYSATLMGQLPEEDVNELVAQIVLP